MTCPEAGSEGSQGLRWREGCYKGKQKQSGVAVAPASGRPARPQGSNIDDLEETLWPQNWTDLGSLLTLLFIDCVALTSLSISGSLPLCSHL